MSKNARYIAFASAATNLVAGDTNGFADVYLRDTQAGTTERVSVASNGAQANTHSYYPMGVSADGRFIVFISEASNLAPGDTNGAADVFVRDRLNRTTIRASARADGTGGNGASTQAAVSADGRWVAFASRASDLVPGDTNGGEDTFVRDLASGHVERVSLTSWGGQITRSWLQYPCISDDGRFVSFTSPDSHVIYGDTNGQLDVFVRDRQVQTTQRVSVGTGGTQANGESYSGCMSGDARFVTFESYATNLDPRDTAWGDVYLHERTDAVPDAFVVLPTTLKFGGVDVGSTSVTQRITVTNAGSVALALPWVGLLGRDPTQFRRVRHCPDPLAARTSCTIDVQFVPTSAGARQARIVISTGPDGYKKTVWLSGTGL